MLLNQTIKDAVLGLVVRREMPDHAETMTENLPRCPHCSAGQIVFKSIAAQHHSAEVDALGRFTEGIMMGWSGVGPNQMMLIACTCERCGSGTITLAWQPERRQATAA